MCLVTMRVAVGFCNKANDKKSQRLDLSEVVL